LTNRQLTIVSTFLHPSLKRTTLTRQIKRKVDTSQHNSHQNIPTEQACDEGKRASGFLTLRSNRDVPVGKIEERAGEESECGDEREEDKEEDEVRADGADEVDEAEEAHANHEVA
jgi:hypothetical protein